MTVGYCMLYNKAIKVQSQTGTEYVSTSLLRQLFTALQLRFFKVPPSLVFLGGSSTPASSQMPTRSLGGEISFVEYWDSLVGVWLMTQTFQVLDSLSVAL